MASRLLLLRPSVPRSHHHQSILLLSAKPQLPPPRRVLHARCLASSSSSSTAGPTKDSAADDGAPPFVDGAPPSRKRIDREELPSADFRMEEFSWLTSFGVKVKMLLAPPWQRVKKGSVLTMKLRGEISDQVKTRFSSGLSLPQICENFIKAAYDPRISGIYLHIEPLGCGWGKTEEIRRHIMDFKKSGKFIVSYMPICGEKEYYLSCACGELYVPPSAYVSLLGLTVQQTFLRGVLEKIGVQPEIQRIGKYKSAGDQLGRKSMSSEVREMLTALLDNIYGNWLDTISSTQGKTRDNVEEFINSGVYQVGRLKEEGWITNALYDDEIMQMLKERAGQDKAKPLVTVDYKKYSKVRKWTLGLGGGRDQIAVIRASGAISRARGTLSLPGSGIIADQLIEKIRSVRESDRYKAVVLRIDSPGGDALASDLLWRELWLLAASKPVVASMADVAASGGYYMAMAAPVIVAEKLTLTGSIGVVTGKFCLQKLYERIDFNKEILSRGKYAELNVADNRPFKPDEAELFAKSAQNAYSLFRNKAAFSRSMSEDEMEKVAQGRVWSGQDALSRGLVDAIGGFSQAVAIAKHMAKIPQDQKVRLVEMTKPSPTLPEVLSGIGGSLLGMNRVVSEVMQDLTSFSGVQARMDGILFERLENPFEQSQLLAVLKDYLNSLR